MNNTHINKEEMRTAALRHDLKLIEICHQNLEHGIIGTYMIQAGMFTDSSELFIEIIKIIDRQTLKVQMNLINDYIEYYNHIYPETVNSVDSCDDGDDIMCYE
jgi:hypothetical protein